MQELEAPLSEYGDERAGVFLTNALTGWEPTVQKPLPFHELEQERERAERVKQDTPVLVILGNPPFRLRPRTGDRLRRAPSAGLIIRSSRFAPCAAEVARWGKHFRRHWTE